MTHFLGIRYGRGCLKVAIDDGPALGPGAIQQMFPSHNWTMIDADPFNPIECANDRFGENFKIQQKICKNTPNTPHIMIGGDHSVNYGHFVALANSLPEQELCLVYIDAHLDIHTPETAIAQASGAPHGTNVRALLGDGDARWLALQCKRPALRPENLFYIGTRSFEPAEIEFAKQNKTKYTLSTQMSWVHHPIGNKQYQKFVHKLATDHLSHLLILTQLIQNIFTMFWSPQKEAFASTRPNTSLTLSRTPAVLNLLNTRQLATRKAHKSPTI